MPIKRIDQTEAQLKAWFSPSGRWVYGLIGLPILISGVVTAISILDRVHLKCDRAKDSCTLATARLFQSKTQTFKVSEIQGVRRNQRNIGLLLSDRDITLWHDPFQFTPDLDGIEDTLKNFFNNRDAAQLNWKYFNYRDGAISTAIRLVFAAFWIVWLGRQSYLLIDRPKYKTKLVQANGLPLWQRSRAVDLIQKFDLQRFP